MPSGTLLTVQEITKATEVFGQTGNYADAGRAIGRDPDVTRRALQRNGGKTRLSIHGEAIDAGLLTAHKALMQALVQTRRAVQKTEVKSSYDGSTHYHAEKLAKLLDSIARATETLGRLAESTDRRRTLRTQRDRTRAETDLLRARAETPARQVIATVVDETGT